MQIVEESPLKDCIIISPKIFHDERGCFFESFNKKQFEELTGQSIDFVQDNQSHSSKGVLRGLHFQKGKYGQAKLLRVIKGSVQDVVVDLRPESSTFGNYYSTILSEKNNKQIFVPRGFAHGFLTLEDNTIINYKCDNYYHKESESGIIYNDKQLQINWKKINVDYVLSQKDLELSIFENLQL